MISTWYCGRLLAVLLLFCVTSRAINHKSQMRKSSFRQTNAKLWGLDPETNSTSVEDESTEDENTEEDSEGMPSEIYHRYMEECSASQKKTQAEEIIVQGNETDNATFPVDLKEVEKQKKFAMEQLKRQGLYEKLLYDIIMLFSVSLSLSFSLSSVLSSVSLDYFFDV